MGFWHSSAGICPLCQVVVVNACDLRKRKDTLRDGYFFSISFDFWGPFKIWATYYRRSHTNVQHDAERRAD